MKENLNNAIHAERERGQQQLHSAVELPRRNDEKPTSVRVKDVLPNGATLHVGSHRLTDVWAGRMRSCECALNARPYGQGMISVNV
ncbi:hypothetical protein niasHS_005927 [Heterodera schachtii]|uniref:PilZ domain-containing protein n=2 Tax=Heterodera TaxID=34509 RepID=A0ABD2JN17_HETSC